MASTESKDRYRYVMHVTETVEYTTAVESERKMTYEELANEAERRRVAGELSLKGVSNVDAYCEAAFRNGAEADCIAH